LVDGSLKSLRGRPGSAVQIKGTVLIDAIQSLKQRRGQQVFEHVVASLEQPFRALLSDVVYPMAWYPLEGLTAFVAAGLCLSGEPEGQLVQRAEAVVEQQLRGIYRIFIKLGSPEFVIKRLSAVHRTYFAGVLVEVVKLRPGYAQVRYTGFGPEHRLVEYMLLGFYRKALTISGARDLEVTVTVPLTDELPHCELTLTWRK